MDRTSSVAGRAVTVLVFMLLGSAVCLAQGPGGRATVADIIVSGNQRTATESITRQLKTRVGATFNPETVQEDVRTLQGTRQFYSVQASRADLPDGRVNVYFMVSDFPNIVQDVVYEGAKKIKVDELEKLSGVRKGMPLSPHGNKIACQAIVNEYNKKGYPYASCVLQEGGKSTDKRVVFNITEGPAVYIRDIDFKGNSFVSGAVLKTHLMSSEKTLGLKIFSKPYNAQLLEMDMDKLREYYHTFGFHSVKVARSLEYDSDNTQVTVVFHIDEGPRYRLADAPQLDGVKNYSQPEIQRLVQARGGEYYSAAAVERDTARIKEYYGHDGHDVFVKENIVWSPDIAQCSLHYEVTERPKARVGQVFVVGNDVTKQNVILREVDLFPGQVLAYPELREAERNLARLNIFEINPETGVRPTVSVLDGESDAEVKDILVQVQETRTGSLLFGLGFNSDAGLTGSIVLNERNFDITRLPTSFDDLISGHAFRGAGQELRLEAVPGTELQRYTFSFREPRLFDSQYSLQVGGYYFTRQFDEYDERRTGTRITVGRKLGDAWTVSGALRVENVDVRNVPPFAPPDYLNVQGNNFLLGLRGGVTYDTRDSFLRPTEGELIDVSYEQCMGEFDFPLVNIDLNKYFTVYQRKDGSGRHVLALHSQIGFAGDNTPVYERFFAGGFRSIRGFQFRSVGPTVNGFKTGGTFLFLNSAEYQIPVMANEKLFVVGFVDSGTLEDDVRLSNYRVSAGVGLRFVVPMLGPVPIALDFGFPIVKADTDREQIFSFWLGFFR